MSIIVEALKKAQGRSSRKKLANAGPETAKPSYSEFRKPRMRKRTEVWVVASILFLAIPVLYFLNRSSTKAPLSITSSIEPPAPLKETPEKASYVLHPVKEENTVPSPPAPLPQPPAITLAEVNKSIDLNGIMYTPEKPLAVINGYIWGEGDYIGEFRVSEIKEDFVKVTVDEQGFVIRLKR